MFCDSNGSMLLTRHGDCRVNVPENLAGQVIRTSYHHSSLATQRRVFRFRLPRDVSRHVTAVVRRVGIVSGTRDWGRGALIASLRGASGAMRRREHCYRSSDAVGWCSRHRLTSPGSLAGRVSCFGRALYSLAESTLLHLLLDLVRAVQISSSWINFVALVTAWKALCRGACPKRFASDFRLKLSGRRDAVAARPEIPSVNKSIHTKPALRTHHCLSRLAPSFSFLHSFSLSRSPKYSLSTFQSAIYHCTVLFHPGGVSRLLHLTSPFLHTRFDHLFP